MARGVNTKANGIDFRANRWDEFLKLVPQNLSPEEKAQVIENIGAIGEEDTLMTINGTGVKKGDAVTTAETAIVVDGAMSDSSQNPVQNKVVKAYVDDAINQEMYDGVLFFSDSQGNIIAKIDKDGIKTVGIIAPNVSRNSWAGRILSSYGDSITATCNGDHEYPYSYAGTTNWAKRVANYLSFARHYGRGIGGQSFFFGSGGGTLSWCDTLSGNHVARDSRYTYDQYISEDTHDEVEAYLETLGFDPSLHTAVRGSLSSWIRIKTMYPESIKDTIDCIIVMAHNDVGLNNTVKNADLSFVENSTDDKEWSESEEYGDYGGDYNIKDSVKGAIASTVMKLKAWMPNALIVLMTPISGYGVEGEKNMGLVTNMQKIAECVSDVHSIMSVPMIDIYSNDSIDGINRLEYISDGIHPNPAGAAMVARAICSGLQNILPLNVEF